MTRFFGPKRFFGPAAAALLALATVGTSGLEAGAQPRPLPQRQLSRGAQSNVRVTPAPHATHLVFGTLHAIQGSAFVLQTRRGALQRVDAAAAIASGRYSAPLFVGKIVAVAGYYDAAHVLRAQSVTRLTRLDSSTQADR